MRPPVWSISRVTAERGHRLAGPGLSDDRERLTLVHVKVEIADNGRRPLVGGERDAQALDVEQIPGLGQQRILRECVRALMPGAVTAGKLHWYTSPAVRERSRRVSGAGEGRTAGTLSRRALRSDLSHFVGEVYVFYSAISVPR